jgi:KDO2-lipid IV(A) lauroyltransferase
MMELLVSPLSRDGLVWLAGLVGGLACSGLGLRRRVVVKNLELAFGSPQTMEEKAQRNQLIREIYRRSTLTFLEFLQAGVRRRDIVVALDGVEEVLPLVTGGPVLMVTGHIGNWEAFGVLLGDYGMEGAMLAKPIHNPLVQRRVLAQRKEIPGVEIILTNNSMKAVVECARQGRHVGFVADQDARRQGVFVPFFGMLASTARGPAVFCRKLGLPLLPMFMVRDASQQLRLRTVVGRPLFRDMSLSDEEDVLRLTSLHTAQLEEVIRKHPSDYFWFHNRWKTRPKAPKYPPLEEPECQPSLQGASHA